MMHEAATAAAFYASPRGQLAGAILARAIVAHWPDLARLDVLGVGYPDPFMSWARADRPTTTAPRRCLGVVTSRHPPPYRLAQLAGAACAADPEHLPFADLTFDRILLVHAVEATGSPERLLREAWRLLRDDGRLLVVAANRSGVWAHVDSTPFGQGQPYSQSQVDRLLARSMFRAERHSRSLFIPPSNWRLLHRGASIWEYVGRALLPQLAGVILTEAVKDAYAAIPTAEPARRRVVLPEAA